MNINLNKSELLKIIRIFLVWRIVLFGIGFLADYCLKYAPTFPYAAEILAGHDLPRWFYSWANFDGVHYLTIIEKGYVGTANIQAFFPVYPLLVKLTTLAVKNAILSGLFISNLMTIVFLIGFYQLLAIDFSAQKSQTVMLLFLIFPTSFFLGSFYSESLFLALVVYSFWAARKGKWWLASLLTAIATATRIVGIFLLPALLIELYLQNIKTQTQITSWLNTTHQLLSNKKKELLLIALGSLGLLGYMAFLNHSFGDPLYFFHVQSEFGGVRQETLVLYPQVLWRSIKILLTTNPFAWRYLIYLEEFAIGLFGLIGIIYSFKKARASYVVFALLAFILPTLTGTFSSLPRYFLTSIPVFIVLAEFFHKHGQWKWLYMLGSGLLLVINIIMFIQGYWVA